jgi:hypothetical protein
MMKRETLNKHRVIHAEPNWSTIDPVSSCWDHAFSWVMHEHTRSQASYLTHELLLQMMNSWLVAGMMKTETIFRKRFDPRRLQTVFSGE